MAQVFGSEGLATLLRMLQADGYRTFGPVLGEHAVRTGRLVTVEDLPRGVGDDTAPGRYRLTERADGSYFGFAAPADSFKALLLPPKQVLFSAITTDDGIRFEPAAAPVQPMAFIGIHGCDLAAIAVLDRVFLSDPPDVQYAARRTGLFLVAVDCAHPSATCFCTSMGSGPAVTDGADLVLTEIGARFLVRAMSPAGEEMLHRLPTEPAGPDDLAEAEHVRQSARASIEREVHLAAEPDPQHPAWRQVAERCLACGNCTMACPTCFCFDLDDAIDPTTGAAERTRTWSSCFERTHSRLHGGAVHDSTASRYRQWLDHKLATWPQQFGVSGCVGCGRCITWCPVGIDITAEAAVLQDAP